MTWYRDSLPAARCVLDASVLINLLGCRAAKDVLGALAEPCVVEEKVLDEVRWHPVPGLCHETEIVALDKSGFIERTSMNDDEYSLFLAMVQGPLGRRLGAGETASISVAHHRRFALVVDEDKARSYVFERFPKIEIVSTLTLLISASVRMGRSPSFLRQLTENSRMHARMGVPKSEKALLTEVLRL